ncbi:MAG: hypothetical protein QM756_35370 [Polyangiaceae bacterium]
MTPVLALVRSPDTLLERIAELGSSRRALHKPLLVALLVHAGLVSWLPSTRSPAIQRATPLTTELWPFELPPPEPEPPVAEPKPEAVAPNTATKAPLRASRSALPPARAAAALTRSDDDDAPLDLTDSLVVGSAESYSGGVSSARGERQSARGGTGVPATNPAARAVDAVEASAPDRSRAAGMLGGFAWNCPFPASADVDGVDQALVTIRVEVDASGKPRRVLVLSDPGHGFGEAARRCALAKEWTAALDRGGRPIAAGLNLNVRFVR